jgi:hypothetical protein
MLRGGETWWKVGNIRRAQIKREVYRFPDTKPVMPSPRDFQNPYNTRNFEARRRERYGQQFVGQRVSVMSVLPSLTITWIAV